MKTKSTKRLTSKRKAGVKSALSVNKPKPGQYPARLGISSTSKVFVDNNVVIGIAAAWACIRVVGETLGTLPWKQYEIRESGRGRDPLYRDGVDRVIRVAPNPDMTPISFKCALGMSAMLADGYAVIERSVRGEPIAMWPLHPSRVTMRRNAADEIVYEVVDDFRMTVFIRSEDMYHIPGPSFDGLSGHRVVDAARNAFGLTVAAEQFGASFFGNSARPSAVVEVPMEMKDGAYRRFRKSMTELYTGLKNVARIAILEDGATWKTISITPDEAQHNETRKQQNREICRLFRVPPHKIGDLEDAHFTNIEHQEIEFVTDTMLPWAMRFEQEADRKLISPLARERRYTKMNLDGLLRGDKKSRNEAHRISREGGWRSANEIREMEDENPIEDPQVGDRYWMPMNYMWADEPRPETKNSGDTATGEPAKESDPRTDAMVGMIARDAMRPTALKLVRGAMDTAWRKEEKARARAVKNDGFAEWSTEFYREHCDYIETLLSGVADAFVRGLCGAEQVPRVDTMCRVVAERYTVDAMKQEHAAWPTWAEQRRVSDTADLVDQLFAMAISGSN
jgi:HK97 family phage portal protein